MVLFIYFLERVEGREKEKEGYISVWLPPTGDQAHNPDLCPDWEELNQQTSMVHSPRPTHWATPARAEYKY